jgi:hypothetical protein
MRTVSAMQDEVQGLVLETKPSLLCKCDARRSSGLSSIETKPSLLSLSVSAMLDENPQRY